MVYLVENERVAIERAINRFHEMCFGREKIDYEEIYRMMSHKDLARICASIAQNIQALPLADEADIEAEYSHHISFTH